MSRATFDELGFLTALGHEFADVLTTKAGIVEVSGSDSYSALAVVVKPPITPEKLASLTPAQFDELATAFNAFFESHTITAAHLKEAVASTRRRWM